MTRRSVYLSFAVILAFGALLLVAVPRVRGADEQPDFTIAVEPLPPTVPYQGLFTVRFTVTNIGTAPGLYQTTDQFATYVLPTDDISPGCAVRYVLVRMHRQVAGIDCLQRVMQAPGESVTYWYTLKAKSFSIAGLVRVNANHNVNPAESDYTNNDARWYLNIDPATIR